MTGSLQQCPGRVLSRAVSFCVLRTLHPILDLLAETSPPLGLCGAPSLVAAAGAAADCSISSSDHGVTDQQAGRKGRPHVAEVTEMHQI